jgi:LysM repeat protein
MEFQQTTMVDGLKPGTLSQEKLMGTSKNRSLVIALVVLIGIIVVGCTRSASTAPPSDSDLTIDEINQRATMDAVREAILTQTHEPEDVIPTATATSVVPTTPPTSAVPTETPLVVVNTPTPLVGTTQTYIVQPGEWVYSIARKFGIDPDALIAANNLQYPFDLSVGQELTIPASTGGTPEPGSPPLTGGTEYIVQAGDWIASIAKKFGVTEEAIIDANNLVFPYTIYPGDVLTIP